MEIMKSSETSYSRYDGPEIRRKGLLRPRGPHQFIDSQDLYDALQVVRQHMKTHFRAHIFEPLCREVCRPHPGFQRAKWMLNRLPPQAHHLWIPIET